MKNEPTLFKARCPNCNDEDISPVKPNPAENSIYVCGNCRLTWKRKELKLVPQPRSHNEDTPSEISQTT